MLLREKPLALETRARNKIENEPKLERPKIALDASAALLNGLFPDADLRSLTGVYNCIGLVVASRRSWVDPEDLIRVLQEDGYKPLPDATKAEAGDVVVYHDGHGEVCHAGIVVKKNLIIPGKPGDMLTVLSKWGADGEYVHGMSYLPTFLGTAREFWTDRRGI